MSITSATAIVMLGIPGLFPVPQQLQQFAADDIFDVDAIDSAEVMMGVDGVMTAGFVFVPIRQNISLMADSASAFIFDIWWATQQQQKDVFLANGNVILKTLQTKWTLTRGALTSYTPIPAAKRVLQPRRFTITWQTVQPQAS